MQFCNHTSIFNGPPGTGKSMLAARLPSTLPTLMPAELLGVSPIHSTAGSLADGEPTDRPPFRSPHRSASRPALGGGGTGARPGEISLAALGRPEVTRDAAPATFIEEVARPDPPGQKLVREASDRLQISARGFHRILELARIIADLDGAETVAAHHLAEAPSCRIDHSGRQRAT